MLSLNVLVVSCLSLIYFLLVEMLHLILILLNFRVLSVLRLSSPTSVRYCVTVVTCGHIVLVVELVKLSIALINNRNIFHRYVPVV